MNLSITTCRRAFTLVEMIVVVVILAILVGAVAPRMSAMTGGGGRSAAEQVAELLSAAASRDSLTSQRLAVDFEGAEGRMALLALGGVEGAPAGVTAWRQDALTPRVMLGESRLSETVVEGVAQAADRWRIEFPRNSPRPEIRIVVEGPRGKDTWVVELGSRASRATVRAGGTAADVNGQAVDLDEMGQGDQPW